MKQLMYFYPFLSVLFILTSLFTHSPTTSPLSPLSVSHNSPFCYRSNRRAAPPWKGRTPLGPPLSSCLEGRRRRRKELREYVWMSRSPCHLWPFSFTLCPTGGAARLHESAAVSLTNKTQGSTLHSHHIISVGWQHRNISVSCHMFFH